MKTKKDNLVPIALACCLLSTACGVAYAQWDSHTKYEALLRFNFHELYFGDPTRDGSGVQVRCRDSSGSIGPQPGSPEWWRRRTQARSY
jgi:hypothetical protein